MTDGREHQVEAIAEAARRARPRTPRWLWLVATIIGAGCALAFVIVLFAEGDPTPVAAPDRPPAARASGLGFGAGLVVGLGGGIAIGFAIARQLRDHSSRNTP